MKFLFNPLTTTTSMVDPKSFSSTIGSLKPTSILSIEVLLSVPLDDLPACSFISFNFSILSFSCFM
uniref:Uncharacterized protein n=1 Tax=Rhizophora mucronata TaxID=61149 RepID=A0A2P2JK01_RHIMU